MYSRTKKTGALLPAFCLFFPKKMCIRDRGGYPVILPVGKPDAFEGLPRQPQRLRPVHPGDERLHGHIFLGGKLGQQVVELEDEPKLFVAEMGFFHGRQDVYKRQIA